MRVAIVILDTGKFDFEQVREMAVELATSHGGTVSAVGGRHLVVPPAPRGSFM